MCYVSSPWSVPCHMNFSGISQKKWAVEESQPAGCATNQEVSTFGLNFSGGFYQEMVRNTYLDLPDLCAKFVPGFYQQKPTNFGRIFMYIWKIQV